MTWNTKTYSLKSSSALIMHNGDLANPFNQFVLASKPIIAKGKKKNEEDLLELYRLEFLGSLYVYPDPVTKEPRIVLPAPALDATITNAAKKSREGMVAKSGFFVNKHAVLEYDGPKEPEKLWEENSFRDIRGVVIGGKARIMRCRPVFQEWTAKIEVSFDTELVNETKLRGWIVTAGMYVGLLEMRPKYGRFTLED